MKINYPKIDEKDFAKAINDAVEKSINEWVQDTLQKKIRELRYRNSFRVQRFKYDK